MSVVFIVPTGIGAAIGGHAGDATPALRLIAEVADEVITHPNVVNASAINEMPENALYVEGNLLDLFLESQIRLKRVRANKILVVINDGSDRNYLQNLVAAAGATCGLDARVEILKTPLKMSGWIISGQAVGEASGVRALIEQVRLYTHNALAIITPIDVAKETQLHYFRYGGVNPWGGIEAQVSRQISNETYKPTAHAPCESEATKAEPEILNIAETHLIDPRMAAEAVSMNYAHCVLKGLHRAPRPAEPDSEDTEIIKLSDVECLISPTDCLGRPHHACRSIGIPVIMVEENEVCTGKLHREVDFIYVKNYLEAAGMVAMLRAGLTRKSVSAK